MIWLAVGVGGAVGSLARHAANVAVNTLTGGRALPYATLVVNLSGCALIGLLAGLLAAGRITMTPAMRVFVFVGVLGGFTTFSTFGLDTFTLARDGQRALAVSNIVAQVMGGLAAVAGGYFAGTRL